MESETMTSLKQKVYNVIQSENHDKKASIVFEVAIIALIVLNVISILLDTFNDVHESVTVAFHFIGTATVIIFTMEYALRVWTATCMYPDLAPGRARRKYMFSFMAVIDLLAILPFYIPFIIPIDLRVLRSLRLLRLLQIFKVNRYTSALSTVGAVIRRKASQLISSLFVVIILIFISAVLMYNLENEAQPEVFKNAFSGLWWASITLTTVGYGDIYPITTLGRILSMITSLLGIGLVAIPTGIISAGFMEDLTEREKQNEVVEEKEEKPYCPHCGKKL